MSARRSGLAPALAAMAALSLLASSALAGPTEPPPPEPDRAAGCRSLRQGEQAVRVAWGPAESTSGCFFFSGPGELGRDDHLGSAGRLSWTGDRMALSFGSLRFDGSGRDGAFTLTRRSEHSFGGGWRVTERIQLTRSEVRRGGQRCATLRGRYTYQECQAGGACPGHCQITASLQVLAR